MSNDHVLRIPNQRGHAADVRAGRERDEVRQQRQLTAPDDRHDKRSEHQANRIVNQQRGENSRSQCDVKQKARRRSR
jgi:hypothetical protein